MLPSGEARKKYIEEITRLLKLWIQDSSLKIIALKAIHVTSQTKLKFKVKKPFSIT